MSARALLYAVGGGIGDALVASVVARALHARFEAVDALVLPAHRDALVRVPDVDEVLVDDGCEEATLAATLAERNYAACAITWATPRAARVTQQAQVPVRVGQARRLYSHRFTQRVAVRSEDGNVTSPWAEILLDYARALDCASRGIVPSFTPTEGDEEEAAALHAELGLMPDGFIILNPANALASRRAAWPHAGWARLARALRASFEVPVVVSGAPSDVAIAQRVCESAADDGVRSIAGRLGIGAFGALAQSARGYVGITTGSMHVAAAVGAPTVGIYPFQSDYPERWAPQGARTAVVRASFCCHPGDTKERCADYACVANLDVDRILAVARPLLRA